MHVLNSKRLSQTQIEAPNLIPELMAYMATIVRVSQDFSGLAWVQYDTVFRRHAALACYDRWSFINSTLYTMCFTGMASLTPQCELGHLSHGARVRTGGDPDPGMKDRLKALETAVLAITNKQDASGKPNQTPIKPLGELCRKWNSVRCTFPQCHHLHVCSTCWGNHPASKCTMRPPYFVQGAHSRGLTPPGKQLPPPNRPV